MKKKLWGVGWLSRGMWANSQVVVKADNNLDQNSSFHRASLCGTQIPLRKLFWNPGPMGGVWTYFPCLGKDDTAPLPSCSYHPSVLFLVVHHLCSTVFGILFIFWIFPYLLFFLIFIILSSSPLLLLLLLLLHLLWLFFVYILRHLLLTKFLKPNIAKWGHWGKSLERRTKNDIAMESMQQKH